MRTRGVGWLTLAACLACSVGVPDARQRRSLREEVREHGSVNITYFACGPLNGLREVVAHTQLTVEGIVSRVDSSLTPDEDDVYTDYTIDVIRLFRLPAQSVIRPAPGATDASPFVTDKAAQSATAMRVRVRAAHGRVDVEGGTITKTASTLRMLQQGQHVIVSAYFDGDRRAWWAFGVFEVRDGRVVPFQEGLESKTYESVEAFGRALANPPPTVLRRR